MIPKCDFRKQFINGKYRCIHNLVKTPYVSMGMCHHCPVAAHNGQNTTSDTSQPFCPINIEEYNTQFEFDIIEEIKHSSNTTDLGPGIIQKAWNLGKAINNFITDGLFFVTKPAYVNRLNICNLCKFRNEAICTKKSCGCNILEKAAMRSEKCPEGFWPDIV